MFWDGKGAVPGSFAGEDRQGRGDQGEDAGRRSGGSIAARCPAHLQRSRDGGSARHELPLLVSHIGLASKAAAVRGWVIQQILKN